MKKTDLTQIKKHLIRGDMKLIGEKTGFHRNYVGQVLFGRIALTKHNEKIIEAALEIIEKRNKINQKANELLNQ